MRPSSASSDTSGPRYNRAFLPMRVARRFMICGRVQGVGFRFFVREAAAREGVAGWVRNLPDGRVEAFVEGDADAVSRVERAIHQGPRGARVDAVAVEIEEATGRQTAFSIA